MVFLSVVPLIVTTISLPMILLPNASCNLPLTVTTSPTLLFAGVALIVRVGVCDTTVILSNSASLLG